jgi:hypothetical protein
MKKIATTALSSSPIAMNDDTLVTIGGGNPFLIEAALVAAGDDPEEFTEDAPIKDAAYNDILGSTSGKYKSPSNMDLNF